MTSQHMEIYLDIALRGAWLVLFVRIKLVHCGYQRVKNFATWAIDDFFLKIINGEKIEHLLMVIKSFVTHQSPSFDVISKLSLFN